MIDGPFEHERVVDRNVAHALDAIPTRLSATRDRLVHDVVQDEEKGLQLRRGASERTSRRDARTRTSSIHHPNKAALKYSSSVNARPLKISTESTTLKPRLSLPPGTLKSRFCIDIDRHHQHQSTSASTSTTTIQNERGTNPTKPFDTFCRHIFPLEMIQQLISQRFKHALEFPTLLRLEIGRAVLMGEARSLA